MDTDSIPTPASHFLLYICTLHNIEYPRSRGQNTLQILQICNTNSILQ